jgi:hypothetical protein
MHARVHNVYACIYTDKHIHARMSVDMTVVNVRCMGESKICLSEFATVRQVPRVCSTWAAGKVAVKYKEHYGKIAGIRAKLALNDMTLNDMTLNDITQKHRLERIRFTSAGRSCALPGVAASMLQPRTAVVVTGLLFIIRHLLNFPSPGVSLYVIY